MVSAGIAIVLLLIAAACTGFSAGVCVMHWEGRQREQELREQAGVARDLLDAAYIDDLTNLYESQGANQAHRVITGIADGVEPMLPRATRFGAYDPNDPDQVF